jgi:hypothetical protein
LRIINEFEKKGSINNSSMEIIDEVLKKEEGGAAALDRELI